MRTPGRIALVLLSLTFFIRASVNAQAPVAADHYNTDEISNRADILKEHPEERNSLEIDRLCQHALSNQDARALTALASIDGDSLQCVLEGLPALSMTVQKQVLAAVLRDDKLWNYDRERKFTNVGFSEGQYDMQLKVRYIVGKVLGKDLHKASKHYDSDPKKQAKAERTDPESAIIDVVTREQLAAELTSQ